MTNPTGFLHPRQESGRGLNTQESGDAGLSSKMEHKFTDNYDKSALPAAEKGSSVMPIFQENLDMCHSPGRLYHAASSEAPPVSAEGGFTKITILPVVQKFPPQTLSEMSPEEETVKVLPSAAAISDGQPHVVVAEEGRSKMSTGPKCPPLAAGPRRIWSHRRRRAAGKYQKIYLLCAMAFTLVPGAKGFPGGTPPAEDQKSKCLTCKDEEICPKLMNIFEHDSDNHLYHRDLNETFPECSVMSTPVNKSCNVCLNQSGIIIFCSEDVGPTKIDLEDSDGLPVDHIPTDCVHPRTQVVLVAHTRTRFGLIAPAVIFLIVVGVLVIK
ncbi:uncharacterized protein LOC129109919 isoform X2 [Anoplopoma fimbria]|uniref:uncharacterized protein LOC129109919 isoform X2 n=1 Tax=Anoplopoma fimbria TaxID=229290 RepID=UPI0023EB30EA|nr:uncharacterized protein LOC129109919 isoform X2 [Anoplopoma fimbria]